MSDKRIDQKDRLAIYNNPTGDHELNQRFVAHPFLVLDVPNPMDFMELERFVAPREFMELGERLRVRMKRTK